MDAFYLFALWLVMYWMAAGKMYGALCQIRTTYTREALLQLKNMNSNPARENFMLDVPNIIRRDYQEAWGTVKKRKRGKRGGVKTRLKKQRFNRAPLPSMIMGNVQSLRNKVDELQGNVRYQKNFMNCCIMAFTETWFTERDRDVDLCMDGFGAPFRLDRLSEVTGKTQGGGVCLYINKRYCSCVTVRERICTPDVELLSVSLRPFYLPREFPQIFITVVYIQPKANPASATCTVFDVVQKLQSISPEAPNFILGDFNHVSLKQTLKTFHQYVSCSTRRGKTLDLCYGSVRGAYKSVPLAPLGSSDHNCVHLLPTYKTVLKREKTVIKEIRMWSEDAVSCLKDCYSCTDWNIFKQDCGDDLDSMVDVTCSYMAFCRDMIIPCKKVKIYSNNKPWVTKSVKSCLQRKKIAFKHGTTMDLHVATKDLKVEILKAKQSYKEKLENKMASKNPGSAWANMKTIVGLHNSDCSNQIILNGFSSDLELANALNDFYCRFDNLNFNKEIQELSVKLMDDQHFNIDLQDVEKAFRQVKANKSPGPDSICGRLLKSCAKELSPVFHEIYNKSLETQHVPILWKDAVVIPVPKCRDPKMINDFRPVALTSILMKILEKLVRSEILRWTEHRLDPMQFAYRPHRGVQDATLTMLNLLLGHLDGQRTHARLLFVDFSSAFNTIQPHILIERLLDQFVLSNNLIGWILNFLTNRTQRVKVNGVLSTQMSSSTGSPQGCVLSPLLFILYTNMCQSMYENRFIIKYADDSVILSLLKENETSHGPIIEHFVKWCDESYLQLNILKTKDMLIDFRKSTHPSDPTLIKGQKIEYVQSYKYLGTIIDEKLNFEENCEALKKKGHQRLYCLRRLSVFNLDKTIMKLFYHAFIESVLSFSILVWYGHISLKAKNHLDQIIKWSGRLIGESKPGVASLYAKQLQRMALSILNDDSHPLRNEFQLLPSARRYKVPRCRTKRHKSSFVINAIDMLNKL